MSLNSSMPVVPVDVEVLSLDDDCFGIHGKVALNDSSLTRTEAPIAVHEDSSAFVGRFLELPL